MCFYTLTCVYHYAAQWKRSYPIPKTNHCPVFLPLKAPICWVIPPNSWSTTFDFLRASNSVVFPWSTCPIIVTTGGRGLRVEGSAGGLKNNHVWVSTLKWFFVLEVISLCWKSLTQMEKMALMYFSSTKGSKILENSGKKIIFLKNWSHLFSSLYVHSLQFNWFSFYFELLVCSYVRFLQLVTVPLRKYISWMLE